MDKEKEIKELEIDIFTTMRNTNGIASATDIAKGLYNAGYRKVDFKKHSPYEMHSNDETLKAYKEGFCDGLEICKQQAIKEFAEKLKYYMYDLPNNTQMKGIEANAINDLLKEYGIGEE